MRRNLGLLLAVAVFCAGCAIPPPGSVASSDWERSVPTILREYNARTKADEAYFQREQARLLRAKRPSELMALLASYSRTMGRVAVAALRDMDAAGEPPPKARRMMALSRRLIKMRVAMSRSCSEALAARDFDRLDRLAAREARELPPVQRALLDEVRRVAPGAMAGLDAGPSDHPAKEAME